MVSYWRSDSYSNEELIQISDVEITNAEFCSSGSFGSRVRSKCIGHNIYTGRSINLRSKPKPTPIHVPYHKS